ncbi:MAG TPA: HDIG domain-containing protein [Candidatus Limnocylindrales bacterium]|nr:HDIG domain-containing protein [Candidatus Limnocylindrales bacterium]
MLSASVEPTSTSFTRRDAGRLIAASAVLVLAMSLILGLDFAPAQAPLELDKPAPVSVAAPRAAEYPSEVLTERAREAARQSILPQYDFTIAQGAAVAAQQVRELEVRVAPIDAAFAEGISDTDRATLLAELSSPELSDAERETLVGLTPDRWAAVRAESIRVLDAVERSEVRDSEFALVRNGVGLRFAGDLTPEEVTLGAALIRTLIIPNSSASAEATTLARERAAALVEDVNKSWERGETIIRAGDRVDAVVFEAVEYFGLNTPGGLDVGGLFGFVILSALVIGMLLVWTWRFRREFWHRNNVLLLLSLLLLVAVVALKLTADRAWLPWALPLAAVGMIVTVLLDAGAAVVMTSLIALLAGAVSAATGTSAGVELAAYVLLGGLAGIVTVRRGDRLAVFVQAGLAVFVVNVLVVATFALFGDRDIYGFLQLLGAAAVSAGGAAIATVGSFTVLGSLFGILTAFQLLELANPSQPLLRRLLVETPGTYHHSLMVGNLAERAAETIGADPLLARVAAYYHDIGKLGNPAAFIENQAGGDNVHDELDPEVSAQLLKSHVSDGIDIAYKSGLPKALIAFIPQHHGTAVMAYFYARAREQAAAPYGGLTTDEGRKAADAVDKRKFRHGGPKPQVREAAIIMLADSVEASVRSLSSRDEPAIRAMVSRIIEERIADDQFDECDLTLRDIEQIREAFIAQLLGMYHQRVAYPQNKVVELESRRASGEK